MKNFESLKDLEGYTGLVVFHAPWCGPCKGYKPRLAMWAGANELPLAGVDIEANRMIAGTYGIKSVPTTMWFESGRPIRAKAGALMEQAMATLVLKD